MGRIRLGKILVVLTLIGLTSSGAFAGDRLRFRSGDVNSAEKESIYRLRLEATTERGAFSSRNFVVQFKSAITEADKRFLKNQGIKVVQYIPDDAYLVIANPDAIRGVQDNPRVQVALPFASRWKKSPLIGAISVFNAKTESRWLISLIQSSDLNPTVQALKSMQGTQVQYADGNILVVSSLSENLNAVLALEGVLWVEPYKQMRTMEKTFADIAENTAPTGAGDLSDLTGYETGTKIMKMDAAWARGFTGRGQIASVADTGLDTGDLKTLSRDFSTVIQGIPFGFGATDFADYMGHGTHVSGSLVNSGENTGGRIRGAAYEANLIFEGIWSERYKNISIPPRLSKLFKAAYDGGARIHSNSWGGSDFGEYDSYSSQVDDFMFNNPEMLILFAAGNDGLDQNKDGRIDENSVTSPGTAKNILSVGASKNLVANGGIQRKQGDLMGGQAWPVEPLASDTLSSHANGLAPFSSRGPTNDGRIKPDIVAPGTNVLSNCSPIKDAEKLWGEYNKDYCWSGGTSMSTPLTAGAATVTRQFIVEGLQMASPSAALVKAMMLHTAEDMFPGQYGEIGKDKGQEFLTHAPDINQGYGLVNMDRLTNLEGYYVKVIDEKGGVMNGGEYTLTLDASELPQEGVKLTLVYTDAAAAPNAKVTLVNNLDLQVTDESGQVYASASTVDNVEQIKLPSVNGSLQVKVIGKSIPKGVNGKQPFALVISKL